MALLTGHGKAKYTTGTRLGSSRERGWRGMLAERWNHSEGDLAAVEPRDTEIIVMIDGALRVRRRGDGRIQDHQAGPGTVWLCPAGIREDMIHLYGDIHETVHMYLPAPPLSVAALQELDLDPDKIRLHYDGGFRDPLIEQIAYTVNWQVKDRAGNDRLLIDHLASALGVRVLCNHSNRAPASIHLPKARGALTRQRLRRVGDYVEAHLDHDLALAQLASEACLSPFHFARAFKAATGTPPHRYVTGRRIARAKRLLENYQYSLAEIALSCGFSSQAHFTKAFKQVVGVAHPVPWTQVCLTRRA